ncbi:MAG: hypothetical protein AABY93_10625 [Bacteroidota bacterium]
MKSIENDKKISGIRFRESNTISSLLITVFLISAFISCATYYEANYGFNQEFENGNLENALASLQNKSSDSKGKQQFLYDVNSGLVLSLLGRYEESNTSFEKAFLYGEDYRVNYVNEAASYLTNPNFTAYRGEDHEHLILLYYKAINYLKLGKIEEALVECRRLNIRLQQLSDRYQSEDKYKEDAFVHTLMGIIYQADKDYNNAFIAYKNALEIYKNDYIRLFKVEPPQQLKYDLLKAAWLSGMFDEFNYYKEEFGMEDYRYQPSEGGELVFFWHNGLSPIKAEWGINFVVSRQGNMAYFSNSDLGISFPFSLENYTDKDKNNLSNLEVFRVAFPRYIERPAYYQTAMIDYHGEKYSLELMEDINRIAFKTLQERMTLEFSKALIRVAMKKATEYEVKKADKTLGSVIGLINAITEKADTRNWQTLPHSIYYCRIPLAEGSNPIRLTIQNDKGVSTEYDFTYVVKKGETLFHTFSSLESGYPNYNFY